MLQPRMVLGYHVVILAAGLLAFVPSPDARAQTPAPTTTETPQPAPAVTPPPAPARTPQPALAGTSSQQTMAPKQLACGDEPSDILPAGNLKVSVTIDDKTNWQPRGGEVKFTIKGSSGFSAENMDIIACFRWKADPKAKWQKSPSLRLIDVGTVAGTLVFSATVPPDLEEARSWWLPRLFGSTDNGVFTGFFIVPIADFRVMAKSVAVSASPPAWSPLDVTLPVGITSSIFAFIITIVLAVIAGGTLYSFGDRRGVPGGKDPILKIISTKGGYASLSQLQIILWSFVIGAGAVFVMSLSGNLILISQGTLVLLGISGAATVASKLQSHAETQSAPPTPPAPPVAVIGLALNGPMNMTEARLSWAAPTSGGAPQTYTVQYRVAAAPPALANPWITASSTQTRPGFRIVGLTPGVSYDFQVFGVNAAGPGVPSAILNQTTSAAPAGQPNAVTNLRPTDVVTNSTIGLAWTTVAGIATYKAQYRVHDSDDGWTDANATSDSANINGLRASTLYDLRVAAIGPAPAAPAPPNFGAWTTIAVATTGPRIPQWSDLVIASDNQSEIDVTRVQMLFFTAVVALFVTLRILVSGEIPTIPDGYLLLMGISNGVYVTAKYIPS